MCIVCSLTFFNIAALTFGKGTGSSSPSSSIPKSKKTRGELPLLFNFIVTIRLFQTSNLQDKFI